LPIGTVMCRTPSEPAINGLGAGPDDPLGIGEDDEPLAFDGIQAFDHPLL
jgi:hypothetical protein